MAAYKEIKGINIQKLSADPPAPIEGQVWYNTTSGVLKGFKVNAGAWATGGNLNTARERFTGAGTQTSAIGFGGYIFPSGTTAITESYDGTSWTEVNDLNTARMNLAEAGADNTSALAIGGDIPPGTAVTESWNGTSWTEVNDLNTARVQLVGAGTQTSALVFGGFPNTGATETWNGTNWTEVNDLNNARGRMAGTGADNTSALAFGGFIPTSAQTESWNGTNWTEVNDLNNARYGLAGAGTNTSSLAFGGDGGPDAGSGGTEYFAGTESWNGTSWTLLADINTTRSDLGEAGSDNTSALAFGGIGTSGTTTATEEWNAGPATVSFGDA